MTFAIGSLGVWRGVEPVTPGRNARGNSSFSKPRTEAIAIVTFVGYQLLQVHAACNLFGHRYIGFLSRAKDQHGGIALFVHSRVNCPPEAFAALPETLTVRIVRYRIATAGFRSQEVILVTTLLDPEACPASALAELYFERWSIELHFREIKTLLGLDVLRCLTPRMVRKEIALHRIAYNLVRLLMQRAGLVHHVSLARISFKGTLDSLHHFADALHALAGRLFETTAVPELRVQASELAIRLCEDLSGATQGEPVHQYQI